MFNIRYSNFVRPSSSTESRNTVIRSFGSPSLSGEEAKRLYLEEIKEAGNPTRSRRCNRSVSRSQNINKNVVVENISKKNLFVCCQNNDVQTLSQILDVCPNMLNITDDYGWSLLMIACQANSVNVAKELMRRGINTSVRDKAGNSAQSLVIKNRNLVLADVLLSYKTTEPIPEESTYKSSESTGSKTESKVKERYFCKTCNKEFIDKEEHVSSTVHNISASKDKKIPSTYIIPASNKGYQIMLKVGWDRESGLGPDGSGKKYPIKTVQKPDRKGLGHNKTKRKQQEKEPIKQVNSKWMATECKKSKSMEINFRRQFY